MRSAPVTHSARYLVRARALTGFVELTEQQGGDPGALLARVGLDPVVLSQPDTTVDHLKVVTLFELAAKSLNVPDFGLKLAALQSIGVLGPVALMAHHAATVREAIASVIRHYPYHTPDASIALTVQAATGTACLHFRNHLPPGTQLRQNTELVMGVAVQFLRALTATATTAAPWRVQFTHHRGLTAAQYRRRLGCTVKLGQDSDVLTFPAELLDIPINAADPQLAETAQRFVAHEMRRHPLDMAKQIEGLVSRQLALSPCSLPIIAQQMNMSVRTLQRRLKDKGLDFGVIVDTVRRLRARELLELSVIPIGEVHPLVGYEDQSSLIRSCLRWFGKTPTQMRGTLGGKPGN